MKPSCLGGISASQFLREYWQKKPLLVRQALPNFKNLITPDGLLDLACRDDVESRLVDRSRSGWRLTNGPFTSKNFSRLPKRNWTLLIQDLNHTLPEASALLQQFDFIPHARVDDVMVSYAATGGGVGPHFDSYDVFLLQGYGQRRWRISSQKNLELVPNAPLKILKEFQAEQEWVLEPGDMLYLPPGYAHDGIAVTECMTYSIGFRAPSTQELANTFLAHLQDNLSLEGRYEDTDLTATNHPGEIPKSMVYKSKVMLQQITWEEATVADFLGVYLSEPKPHVFFVPPARPLSAVRFASVIKEVGLKLSLKSRMLYRKNAFYMNGERFDAPKISVPLLQMLADRRTVETNLNIDEETLRVLWDWYCAGFIELPRRGTNKKTKGTSKDLS
ncbi:MAG: cupin domain-containing protein [Pseudomonadota bacterium]